VEVPSIISFAADGPVSAGRLLFGSFPLFPLEPGFFPLPIPSVRHDTPADVEVPLFLLLR